MLVAPHPGGKVYVPRILIQMLIESVGIDNGGDEVVGLESVTGYRIVVFE